MTIEQLLAGPGIWIVFGAAWLVATGAKAILARSPELRLHPWARFVVLALVLLAAVGASFLAFYAEGPLLLLEEGLAGVDARTTVILGLAGGGMELGGYKLLSRLLDLGLLPPKYAKLAEALLQRSADFRRRVESVEIPAGDEPADPPPEAA